MDSFDLLCGFRVRVCEHLAGCKVMAIIGDELIVSPAVFKLMEGATEEELRHLLSHVKAIHFPKPADWMMGW